MKITVDVECTPEEARLFLGLPDLKPMQEALLNQLQDRLTAGLQTMDGETLLRTWLPSGLPTFGVQAFEQLTKAMMANLDTALGKDTRK